MIFSSRSRRLLFGCNNRLLATHWLLFNEINEHNLTYLDKKIKINNKFYRIQDMINTMIFVVMVRVSPFIVTFMFYITR